MRVNRELGPYTLLEQIAVGGMAEIYLAKTKGVAGFEKHCALKIILPEFANDDGFVQMLIDEAKITVGLSHTNIAQIFELGRCNDTYYIAMEHVDGADLFRIMRSLSNRGVQVPIHVAAYLAQEICTGLEYAHSRLDQHGNSTGIIHRDISPQNILVSYAGEVKIVDFGIAKAASRSRQTQTGVIKGKYFYMSPEQAWGDPVDRRTDIFSAGIVLYEVLTGQMLYTEEDMRKLLHLARQAEIPPPTERRADIPPQLVKLVMKALERRPEDRWQTAGEFQSALTSFLFSSAPDFTPDQVARLVRVAMDDEDQGSLPRSQRPPAHDESAWRDVPSPLPHDAGFAFDDMTPIESSVSSSSADQERTMVSGPPRMVDSLRSDAGVVTGEQNWEDDTWTDATAELAGTPRAPAEPKAPEVIVAAPESPRLDGDDEKETPAIGSRRRVDMRRLGEMSDSVVARMEPTFVGFAAADIEGSPSPAGQRQPAYADPTRDRSQRTARSAPGSSASDGPRGESPGPSDHAGPDHGPSRGAPAAEAANERLEDLADGPAETVAELADTRPRPAVQPPIDLGQWSPPAGPGQSAGPSSFESPTASVPSGQREPRHVWRIALLAFSVTAALTAGAIGFVLYVLPQLNVKTTLEVISVPEGAFVELDGKKLPGRTRMVIPIDDPSRPYRVTVSLPDHASWTSTVRFEGGEERKQLIASLIPKFGRLLVESVPSGAEVLLNGRSIGKTPVQQEKLSLSESPKLELRLPGHAPERRKLKWGKQTWQRVKVVMRKKRRRRQ